MRKILIIGASGFVGGHLYKYLKSKTNFELFGTYNKKKKTPFIFLNYYNKDSFIKRLELIKPEIIIWSAGEKNLNVTENDSSFCYNQNVGPIKTILYYQNKVNSLKPYLIFLSSDYVFSGDKGYYKTSDCPDPKTKYGKYKYFSELEITQKSNNYCIIRVGGIVGEGGTFFSWIFNEIRNNRTIELYPDFFSPTPIQTLCEAIFYSIDNQINGTYHLSGNVRLSKFQFGKQLKKCFKQNDSKLTEKKKI